MLPSKPFDPSSDPLQVENLCNEALHTLGTCGSHVICEVTIDVQGERCCGMARERQDKNFRKEINEELRSALNEERNHSFDQRMKISELQRLLDNIPREELDKFLSKQKEYQR